MSTRSLLMNNHKAAVNSKSICCHYYYAYGPCTIVITARDEMRVAHGRAEAATNFAL